MPRSDLVSKQYRFESIIYRNEIPRLEIISRYDVFSIQRILFLIYFRFLMVYNTHNTFVTIYIGEFFKSSDHVHYIKEYQSMTLLKMYYLIFHFDHRYSIAFIIIS